MAKARSQNFKFPVWESQPKYLSHQLPPVTLHTGRKLDEKHSGESNQALQMDTGAQEAAEPAVTRCLVPKGCFVLEKSTALVDFCLSLGKTK